MMISIIMVMMARRSRKKRGYKRIRNFIISTSIIVIVRQLFIIIIIIIIIIVTMIVITTIRGPRLVDQSAERGSKRCREMRRTKIWASVRLSPFLSHLSMLSFTASGCQTEGKNFGSFVQTTSDPIINNIQSQPWSHVPLLIVQHLVEQTSKTRLFLSLCLCCLFVCLCICVLIVGSVPAGRANIY